MENRINLVDKDYCKDLVCEDCSKYLSVPGIYLTSSKNQNKYINWLCRFKMTEKMSCGRTECIEIRSSNKTKKYLKSEKLEKLFKFFKFPCSMSQDCQKLLAWGLESEQHENLCPYRTIKCLDYYCQAEYPLNELKAHFSLNHRCIQHNKSNKTIFSFQISIERNVEEVVLLQFNQTYYLLDYACNDKDNNFQMNVFKVAEEPEEIGKEHFRVRMRIPLFERKFNQTNQVFIFKNLEAMRKQAKVFSFNECKESFILTINILSQFHQITHDEDDEGNQYNDLLDCPVCYQTMAKEIFLCESGHSICSECKYQHIKCGMCQTNYTNIRNFSLENFRDSLNGKLL